MAQTMRAVTYSRFGDSAVLEVTAAPVPETAPGMLRVRVAAAGINPLDWKLLRGDFALVRGRRWPRFLGCDFAGRVDAVGAGTSGWQPGDRVFGSLGSFLGGARGALSEYVVVAPTEVQRLPDEVSFSLGAALPIAGVSALQCIELAAVARDAELLVIGAAGGVGSFTVCLAAARGVRVTAVCRSTNADYVRALGAEAVIARDQEDVLASGRVFDAVIDAAAAHDFRTCATLLQPRGCYVLTVPNAAHFLAVWRGQLFGGKQARALMAKLTPARYGELAAAATAGKFARIPLQIFPWTEVRTALDASRAGSTVGKIVVELPPIS